MTLQASQLAHARGNRKLFDGLDLEVQAGEALRVVGRNGSGKTSLLRVLSGLAEPLKGQVLWQGRSIRSLREDFNQDLVYVGHGSGLKDDFTASENVQISAVLSGRSCSESEACDALDLMGLRGRAHLPARVLSQGQRRRVMLARLAIKPVARLAILDEPFNALDQESVDVLSSLLSRQLAEGAVVVYTTHQSQTLAASRTHEVHLDGAV
ncbi:cytochrome c biogenesis heme-transporting ATPase CcmA [Aquabacterium sp.]|uniref:cytochrome c biogenesis heme-transporting ATPase CcmA n=1 Tax=Aquabacterium sp. TaxID=1872578 RepID=UPI003D6D12D6